MPATSFDVFGTSTEHLLCGMHSVIDAIGCIESADELKTLGLNFMREHPTVAFNDAGQTPRWSRRKARLIPTASAVGSEERSCS